MGEKCLDCGKDYSDFGLDALLSRPQWLLIHPDEDGLLCASCIVKRAAQINSATCVRIFIEIEPRGREG